MPASISAQLTLRVSGDRPTTTVTGFSLVSGSAQDGTWRSSERLQLVTQGVYDAAVERSPFVHSPLPVEASLRPQEAIVSGLPHVREVLCIHENAKRAKASFNKHAK